MAAKKILWVEDDDDLVEALQPQLEREGWAVHRIDSAKAMAAKVAEVHPDAIVMDIIMPGEHGFSATEDLKGRDDAARIPVIVYTSVTHRWAETTATREDGLLSQADEFIDKAQGPAALIRTLHKHLSGK